MHKFSNKTCIKKTPAPKKEAGVYNVALHVRLFKIDH